MTEYAWGCDPAMSHISMAFADMDSDEISVETLITKTDAREGARLGLLDRRIRIWARELSGRYPPACVWVEAPAGQIPNLQLSYAVGVIQAALAESLPCPVWSIPSGKWKKVALGYGNASKGQVKAWSEAQKLGGESQDEHDALAIAFAGRRLLQSRQWDVAA